MARYRVLAVGVVAVLGLGALSRSAGAGPDGPLIRTVLLDQSPSAVVVDPRSGHTFVATSSLDRGGEVWTFATASGLLLRKTGIGREPVAMAVAAQSGRLFVANEGDRSVSVLATASGTLVRTVTVSPLPHDIVVDERAGRIVVVDDGGYVSLLDPVSGALRRTIALGSAARLWGTGWATVDPRSGHVFVTAQGADGVGRVSLLDAVRGRVLHTVALGSWLPRVAVDGRSGRAFVSLPNRNAVAVLALGSGRLLGMTRVGANPWMPVVDERNGRAFVANYDGGSVSVLDSRSGRLVRTVAVGGTPGMPLIDARAGRVVVQDEWSGRVHLLDTWSGVVVRTLALGPDAGPLSVDKALALDQGRGRIVIDSGRAVLDRTGTSTNRGTVSVVDTSSGRLLRQMPGTGDVLAVAVDARAGRAVIVAGVGLLPPPQSWQSTWAPLLTRLRRWLPWLAGPAAQAPARVSAVAVPGSVTILAMQAAP